VILAAGDGSRYTGSTHKLLVPLAGEPLVTHAIRAAAQAGLDHVLVVTGSVDLGAVLPPGVEEVTNPRWAEGQATSLQAGVRRAGELGCRAVVVGLGDQPFIAAIDWQRVAAADRTPLAAGAWDGHLGPPVRIAAECWPDLPAVGDAGARRLLANRHELVTEVPCVGRPDDIDTVEDLARWS